MSATTAAHFRIFEKAVHAALRDLGVNDWKVYVEHVSIPGRMANCTTRLLSRVAIVRLARRWADPPTVAELLDSARHEALHVAFAPLSDLVGSRYITEADEKQAAEAMVQRFLRCVRWGSR